MLFRVSVQFSQSLSHVQLFATPWTAACQASLSITNSQSPPKLMSIESVMPSNHLILCRPLLLLPSVFPSIRVFSLKLCNIISSKTSIKHQYSCSWVILNKVVQKGTFKEGVAMILWIFNFLTICLLCKCVNEFALLRRVFIGSVKHYLH